MKKSVYLALTVTALALFACNSKPAESEQQSEEQIEQVAPAAEAPAEAEEAPALETEEPLAEESAEAVAEEAPAAEEPAPAEPAAEPEEEETVFMVVESMAVLPCSGAEMAKLLTVDLNQVDPSADKCRVVVTVIVEKDGRVTHPTVKRPIGNENWKRTPCNMSSTNSRVSRNPACRAVNPSAPTTASPSPSRNNPREAFYPPYMA